MFNHIALNRTTTGWQVIADGEDITDNIVGWHVELNEHNRPYGPPRIWLAFLPDGLTVDSGSWRDEPCGPADEGIDIENDAKMEQTG